MKETTNLSIKSVDEVKGVLDGINTEEYSLINYVYTEYGFYPTYFNELFRQFFEDVKGPIIGFCFPGQEIFYEGKVDILVSLEGFIDTTRAYSDNKETDLLLNNFNTMSDRGIAFWFAIRNFDEDEYEAAFSGYEFRNIVYPIGKTMPWTLGWPPGPGHQYGVGEDGPWTFPSCKYFEDHIQSYDYKYWTPGFKRAEGLDLEEYNTFFVKNSFKTRDYSSKDITDFLVGKDGVGGALGFGSVELTFYMNIVQWHILNKKHLVIIHDLVKFPEVTDSYIHYVDMKGNLDVRLLVTIIDDSNTFINSGTSPGDLAAYYSNANQLIVGDQRIQNRTKLTDVILGKKDKKVCRFHTEQQNYDEIYEFLSKN